MLTDVQQRILALLEEAAPDCKEKLAVETELVESGILGSLEIMRLVASIESAFGIQIADADFSLDYFVSVERLSQLVASYGTAAPCPA